MENDTIYAAIDPSGNACVSHIPYCGYSYEILQDMAANGFKLQIAGKAVKMPTRAEFAMAQARAKKQTV